MSGGLDPYVYFSITLVASFVSPRPRIIADKYSKDFPLVAIFLRFQVRIPYSISSSLQGDILYKNLYFFSTGI